MSEVVYGPIEEESPPMPPTDWRWQEVLALGPFAIMEELTELDTALFAARSEQKEATRELADLEDVLYRFKAEHLEKVATGQNQDLKDRLFKGGTKDERAARQETHLSGMDSVQQWVAEIKAARERKDNAQVAFDSLMDRQTNLGRFANMYAATARLLASIRTKPVVEMVERMPDEQFENLLAYIAELREGEGVKEGAIGLRFLYGYIIRIFASQPENSIHSAISSVYEEAQAWVQRATEWSESDGAMDPPPVDTSDLVTKIMQVVKPMQAPPDLEPVLEEEAQDARVEIPDDPITEESLAAIAALGSSDADDEIPPMDVDDVQAAIRRHEEEEEPPFQPDEVLSL